MARYVVAESAGGQPPKRQLRKWWKESSVYQVYPASFQDSTGSGVGDLKGIIDRVDHFKSLGVDIVWLCPIFESPQIDMVSFLAGSTPKDIHDLPSGRLLGLRH